jgi:type IV pilus assembly protein PilE
MTPLPKKRGFSLLELLLVLALVSILAALSSASYLHYITRVNRIAAEASLLDLSARLERYYALNQSYEGASIEKLSPTNNANYQFALSIEGDQYLFKAIPQGAQAAHDQNCATLSIDNLGQRFTSGGGGLDECW